MARGKLHYLMAIASFRRISSSILNMYNNGYLEHSFIVSLEDKRDLRSLPPLGSSFLKVPPNVGNLANINPGGQTAKGIKWYQFDF